MLFRVSSLCFILFVALSCSNKNEPTQVEKPVEEPPLSDVAKQLRESYTEVKKVSISEAKTLAKKEGYTFIDLRTPGEIEKGKIEGAIEINMKSPNAIDKVFELPRENKYILYCKSGGRSGTAAKLFSQYGFTNTVDMTDGYSGWKKEN